MCEIVGILGKQKANNIRLEGPQRLKYRGNASGDRTNEEMVNPGLRGAIMPLMAAIPAQLFSCFIAVKRGCDIDKPRNLAISVTFE